MRSDTRQPLAIFLPSLRQGGAERAMVVLSVELAKRGYPVDLVLVQAEGPHMAEVSESVRVVDLGASRVLSSLPALARYMWRQRPRAMLSVMNHANIVALWARRLTRVCMRLVVSERNTLSASTENSSNLLERRMPRLIKRFYPWADGITAVSHGVADDLAQVSGIPREQIEVVYNPIARPELRRKAQTPIEHPWFAAGQPPVVLAVGRLRAQKDFPNLLRAFAQARRDRPAHLLILGEGPDRELLEAMVREFGLEHEVSLPGFVPNPYAYMRRASVFVLSSRWEGLPAVLIEALYCGAQVISTDCPSGPREILSNGKYGQLVSVGDVTAIARAISTALDGNGPFPCRESWRPFEIGFIADRYIRTLKLDS